ncbi:MAG: hypothetical protein ACD_20C00153G0001, partial [uncultured bacterium]
KGRIGNSFLIRHIKLSNRLSFSEIKEALESKDLLINSKDSEAKGVVPFNIGLLPWRLFSVLIIANSWEETLLIAKMIQNMF